MMKVLVLIIASTGLLFSQKLNEARVIDGQVKKWNGKSWSTTAVAINYDTAVVLVSKNKLSNEYRAKDSTVSKLIAGSNVTVQRQGTSGAWKITATTGGPGGTTDTTSLSNRIDAKQDIIPNIADTAKYLEKSDTTYLLAGKLAGKQATIANLADTAKYLEVSDTTYLLAGKLAGKQATIANLADTSKYVEGADTTGRWAPKGQYMVVRQRNGTDTTLLQINGGSDTTKIAIDSTGLIRTPHLGIKSYQEDVDEFMSTTVTSKFNWTATNSTGSHAATPSDTTGIGQQRGTTGASATGSSYQSTYVQSITGGNGTIAFEARVRLNQIQANGTGGCFKYCVGFGDVVTGAISTDGVWFQNDSISAGKWVCYSKSGANLDSASVGNVITANTWYVLRAEIDGYKGSTLPSVRFYVNGTLVRTIYSATKVPVGTALFGMMTGITKFTGSNAVAKTYDIDYFYYSKKYGYNIPVTNR